MKSLILVVALSLAVICGGCQKNPVAPSGSTVELTPDSKTISAGSYGYLTAVVKDADGKLLNGKDVRFSSSSGRVTVNPTLGSTDASGQIGVVFDNISSSAEGIEAIIYADIVGSSDSSTVTVSKR